MNQNRKSKFGNPAADFLASDAEPPRCRHDCAAFGCPLPGSISPGTKGDGPWYCFLHFGAKTSRNDLITSRIRSNLWIVRLWQRVQRLDFREWDRVRSMASDYCAKHGRTDLGPELNEDKSRYVFRLQCTLKHIVFPKNDHEDVVEQVELLPEAA